MGPSEVENGTIAPSLTFCHIIPAGGSTATARLNGPRSIDSCGNAQPPIHFGTSTRRPRRSIVGVPNPSLAESPLDPGLGPEVGGAVSVAIGCDGVGESSPEVGSHTGIDRK